MRDPQHPIYVSSDRQELHGLGHPALLARMNQLGCTAKIFTVQGVDDQPDGLMDKYAANMTASGLEFTNVGVTIELVDGKIFSTTGNRTAIARHVAGEVIKTARRAGLTDFERKEDIRYPTAKGV